MSFMQLKHDIRHIVEEAKGHVAISISTDDGDIHINENDQIKAASVIKVPMVMAGLFKHDRGELDLQEKLNPKDTVGGCGVLHYFVGDENISLLNIMKLAIIVSDNTASNIIMDTVGIEDINHFMKLVGAKGTKLERKFMDLEEAKKGLENVTTASDMLTFLKVIGQGSSDLSLESRELLLDTLNQQQFKHKLPFYQSAFLEHDIRIAHKTGEITGHEHDVGIFSYQGKSVYVAVLTSEWKHNYEAQQLVAKIGKYIMSYLTAN